VEHWKQASERAPYGEIEQASQMAAMAKSWHDVRAMPLIYCVNPDEKGKVPDAVVQHESAAVNFPKMSGWRRYVGRLTRKRAAKGGYGQASPQIEKEPAPAARATGRGGRTGYGGRDPGCHVPSQRAAGVCLRLPEDGPPWPPRRKSLWPPEHIKEWNDAVDEYRAIQARPDKPKDWNTRSQSC
jgi:hypothetical protein